MVTTSRTSRHHPRHRDLIRKEALNNVRKHASAQNVSVSIGAPDGPAEVTVADDGVGLGPAPPDASPGHRGVVTMQRTAMAGGRCTTVTVSEEERW